MPEDSIQKQKLSSQIWLAGGLIFLSFFVAWLDMTFELGRSYWVLHFPLIIGSVFLPYSWLPGVLTLVALTGNIVGFYTSPVLSADQSLAWVNRGLGLGSTLIIGIAATLGRRMYERIRHQAIVKRAQAELTSAMNGVDNLGQLSKETLLWFEKSLSMLGGSLYTLNDSQEVVLAGRMGWGRDDKTPPRFRLGEGLIGKAALSHGTVVLSDLPEDYFYSVESSLGKMRPRHLLIAPLVYEQRCFGVLELAFKNEPGPILRDLLDEISSNIAISIRSIKDSIRLHELLEESQAQAEELQTQSEELKTQQEELRSANEELSSHTEALEESQAKLEEQQAELENSNEQLRLQRNALMEANNRLRKTEEDLRIKGDELAQASQYKSEFLANMSHELRTPLNSILILSRLLYENKGSRLHSEQLEFAKTIEAAGNDLLDLINDILDHSRIESGKIEVVSERYEVADLVKRIQVQMAPAAQKKGLEFLVETDQGAPQSLYGDQKMTLQILKNFMSNAMKFTDEGRIRLVIERPTADEWESDDPAIKFSVVDTGIGIEQDKIEMIFEAFRQADGTTRRKYGGTGLGLSICKNLARVLEGDIHVESTPGEGSRFSLIVPERPSYWHREGSQEISSPMRDEPISSWRPKITAPPQHEQPEPVAASSSEQDVFIDDDREQIGEKDKVVLIVEDDRTFAKYLRERARQESYKTLVTPDGEEGLRLARQFSPSAILLDIRLPTRSGLSVLEQVKSQAGTRHIPVYIISAIDYSKNSMHLGAVGYLRKPIQEEELKAAFEKLGDILNKNSKRVLVIEDNELQRKMICELVADNNVETVPVGTGREALSALRETPFDCIVLDLRLPDMTGAQLLERLSETDVASRPPVIVYTGKDLSREEEEGLKRHSDSIILKGARSPERLLDETTLFLHRIESELNEERREMLERLRERDRNFEKRRILVVDDDMRNVFALSSVIEGKGADVIVGRNGHEAIEHIQGDKDIDLVLMDIMMPEMDGLEAIQHIRNGQGGRHRDVPIIALTAKAMKGDQEKCLAAGANDYLAKPVNTDQLMSLMRVWLHAGAQWGSPS